MERKTIIFFGYKQKRNRTDRCKQRSAQELVKIGFDGYSIGGTSIGEPKDVMKKMVEYGVKYLPEDKPRYLMGVGSVDEILDGISQGVDMFDCVLPTRIARSGGDYKIFEVKGDW